MYWVSITTKIDTDKYETTSLFKQSITDTLLYIEEIKNQDNVRITKIEVTYCEVE